MRHHPHFSRSHHADAGFEAGADQSSFHALWHVLARHYQRHGEQVAYESGERFGRRHRERGESQPFNTARDDQRRTSRRDFRSEADPRGESGYSGNYSDQNYRPECREHREHADFRDRARFEHIERRRHHDQHGHHGHDRFALHALWHMISRHDHRGGGRGGRFGGAPGGFGGDGDGFPRGRKFTSEDLQLLLLSMIDAQPSHGYELIKALETRSNGFYSPSPGMVYPALTYLEELGYVTVQLEGNRKRYELSETGRDYLNTNRERVELMLAKLNHIARKMDSVRRAFAGEEPADISEGGWLPELNEARRTLKRALLRRDDAPAAEQRRIADVLMRAAREIEGDGKPRGNESTGENPGNDGETNV